MRCTLRTPLSINAKLKWSGECDNDLGKIKVIDNNVTIGWAEIVYNYQTVDLDELPARM